MQHSERRRNLEILKYGHAARINYGDDQFISADPTNPQPADDAILTGLCQVIALRLKCSNAFICLSDSHRQHVLAEATQTISPYDHTLHAPDDGLMFGVQSFDHKYGISQLTLPAYTHGEQHFVNNTYTFIDDKQSIFLDLTREPLLADVPFVKAGTKHQLYVEVPLKNTAGVVVGICGALDYEPRSNFADIDIRSIIDVARMITEHLELLRLRDSQSHAERLIQALGYFSTGRASLIQTLSRHPAPKGPVKSVDTGRSNTKNTAGSIPAHTNLDGKSAASVPRTIDFDPSPHFANPFEIHATGSSTFQLTDSASPAQLQNTEDDSCEPLYSQGETSSHLLRSPNYEDQILPNLPPGTYKAFSRAANLIREAMNLDGTCFIKPSSESFSVYSDQLGSMQASTATDLYEYHANTEFNRFSTQMSNTDGIEGLELDDTDNPYGTAAICNLIALSIKDSPSLKNTKADEPTLPILETTLRALVLMYPRGHVFHFDSRGMFSSTNDPDTSQRAKDHLSKRHNARHMLESAFPNAQSLLFMPLYDKEQQKLNCAFFGWLTDPFRVLDDSDAIYVSGFSHMIICEVLRLETLAVERAKTVFMSSISHELRSPLHGILAATELLRGLHLGTEQTELALMVDSCGRTLLDVVNNLLEYAKINNGVDNRSRGRSRRDSSMNQQLQRITDSPEKAPATTLVDLVEVTEDTVVSVFAGYVSHMRNAHRVQQDPMRFRASPDISGNPQNHMDKAADAPTVVVNIHKHDNWRALLDAGTWRRIVMNLVGNALKYTTTGYILIEMDLTANDKSSGKSPQQLVLRIKDSGQGISEDYLRHRLYTPFAQENQLSVGVGLGLSIVHRLVTSLDGIITMNSKVDIGTTVEVALPLPVTKELDTVPRAVMDTSLEDIRKKLVGIGFTSFCAFDPKPSSTDTSDVLDPYAEGLLQLAQSLSTMVSDWFGVSVTQNISEASFCFLEASQGQILLDQDPRHEVFSKPYVVVNDYIQSKRAKTDWPGESTAIATPIGPAKLARVLQIMLQKLGKQKHRRQESSARVVDLTPGKESSHAEQSVDQSCHLLLVDDNEINLRLLAAFVRKLKFSYSIAKNGQEALDLYVAHHQQGRCFQYVFMDISMPIMDGLEATRHIRAYEKDVKIKTPAQIYALTGLGHIVTQNEAMASGIDQYFRKPVRLEVLKSVLLSSTT